MRTAKGSTNAFRQLLSIEQIVWFDDGPLAITRLGLMVLIKAAFGWQKEGQNAYSFSSETDVEVIPCSKLAWATKSSV